MCRKLLFVFFLMVLLLQSWLIAQVPVMWEPDLSLSGKWKGQWTWNAKFSSRIGLGQFGEVSYPDAGRLKHIDAQGFINRQLVGSRRIALGFLYRVEDPFEQSKAEKRINWQYSFRTPARQLLLVHRIRIEQRFFDESFQHRARYRISAERPLQGDKLDSKEFYLIAGSELLASSDERFSNFRIDNRTGIGIGLLFANEHRLQIELQHRAQRLFDKSYNSGLWLLSSWILPL